jgi:hypothetical protein
MKIKAFTSGIDNSIDKIGWLFDEYKLDKVYHLKQGWLYYVFITPERTWIRHSGKLTKEEKQHVIKFEIENGTNNNKIY